MSIIIILTTLLAGICQDANLMYRVVYCRTESGEDRPISECRGSMWPIELKPKVPRCPETLEVPRKRHPVAKREGGS